MHGSELFRCIDCQRNKFDSPLKTLPIWYNCNDVAQYSLPSELVDLREGEKLLIQIYSAYIPLQHLRKGAHGVLGHVCCFQQDIMSVCYKLPRKNVEAIKILKNYKDKENRIGTISFMIRKTNVLAALSWLVKYNPIYKKYITIKEDNLDWMGSSSKLELRDVLVSRDGEDIEPQNGPYCVETNTITGAQVLKSDSHFTSQSAWRVARHISETLKVINKDTMEFPYQESVAVDEFNDADKIFCKVFPWLFFEGIGDFYEKSSAERDMSKWIRSLLLYEDGRFAEDKMFCFFANNFLQRHLNDQQGSFYVNQFDTNGPKTLHELQTQIEQGNKKWIDKLLYFGSKVIGSAAYWRERQAEVYS